MAEEKSVLIFATDNANKVNEIRKLLPDNFPFKIVTKKEAGIDNEIEETGSTITENAIIKASYIKNNYGMDCFAEDTGLIVEALDGEPGVFSARYAGPESDSDKNIELLLHNLRQKQDRTARFVTVIALMINDEEYIFEGEVHGRILNERKGNSGFGYDPVFLPDGYEKSFAEMNANEKNLISHRARAFAKLAEFLVSNDL
jgi:XTP/dITP diphosphohydrolase